MCLGRGSEKKESSESRYVSVKSKSVDEIAEAESKSVAESISGLLSTLLRLLELGLSAERFSAEIKMLSDKLSLMLTLGSELCITLVLSLDKVFTRPRLGRRHLSVLATEVTFTLQALDLVTRKLFVMVLVLDFGGFFVGLANFEGSVDPTYLGNLLLVKSISFILTEKFLFKGPG